MAGLKLISRGSKLQNALLLVMVLWLAFGLIGRVLRHIAIVQIEELTGAKIKIKSIRFNPNGSVFIKRLTIMPGQKQSYNDAILKAERVHARFSVGSLLSLQPKLKEISVNDFIFNAQHNLDTNQWNIAAIKIKAEKNGAAKIPLVSLKKGTLTYSKVLNGRVKIVAAVPVDAQLGPDKKNLEGYRFNITTATKGGSSTKSVLTGLWRPGNITITGGIASTDIPAFERAWTIDILAADLNYEKNQTYSLKLKIKNLTSRDNTTPDTLALVEPSFLEKFGSLAALQEFFSQYRPSGQADIELKASGNWQQPAKSTLVGKIHCKDVCVCYTDFPYFIEHLVGQIDFTENSVVLNNLRGRHNNVVVFFNGWSMDFVSNWRYQFRITSDNMALDSDLYNALSTKQKELWSAFSPSGIAAIDYRLTRQSQTDKNKNLAVDLLGAEAVYRNFPYPLRNLAGGLLFDSQKTTISDVVSQTNGCKIIINGSIAAYDTNQPTYDVSVNAENVPLDSTLGSALPAKQRTLYNQLDIAGLVDADVKIFTPTQNSSSPGFAANVSCKKTSLKINKFPLPISDVSAKVVLEPDLIRIQNLTGRYNQGLVSLTGQIWPNEKTEQLRYSLSLRAERVQLNSDLFGLLPTSIGKVVSDLQPEGKIDCSAHLSKTTGQDLPDYKITVDCLGNSINCKSLPYPLKDITGTLTITKNSIGLANITAAAADSVQIMPTPSTIKITGQIAIADNTLGDSQFALSANDIFLDQRLGIALPEKFQPLYTKLAPTGRIDLNFDNITVLNKDDGGKYVDFAGDVKFKNCNFNISTPVTDVDAVLKTKGLYKTGDRLHSGQAVLVADGIRIKDKSLTDLKANIYYDPNQNSWLTKNLIADCYDGKLTGRFELKQPASAALTYLLDAGFHNVDLKQFLSDTKAKETSPGDHTSGKMNGLLSISAVVGDNSSSIGRCHLLITDMQVGKLSPLAKVLSVLKLTEPKDFAFNQMLIDSYIKHNTLLIQRFDLSGQSVAFNGSGSMDLQNQNIDLALTARGRRLATAEPSLLQSLTDGLGHAVVRMDVTGSIYDPQVTTTTLPVIKETLEILGTKPVKPR